jgi:hypothetical protein
MRLTYLLHTELSQQNPQFQPIVEYVTEFLTDQHPARSGCVCPFVTAALSNQTFRFAILEGSLRRVLSGQVQEAIAERTKSSDAGAIVLVFKTPISYRMLDQLHLDLILEAIEHGCMIGMLGPKVHVPSLHHPDFYPFRAPQNIIAVRKMIPHDVQFFGQSRLFRNKRRIKMYEAFLARFSNGTSMAEVEAVAIARSRLARERTKWF